MAELQIGRKTYQIVDPDELTWDEWIEVERISGVLPDAFGDAIGRSNPRAWKALVLLSIWRVEPTVSESALGSMNFAKAITAIVESWQADTASADEEELGEALPPEPPPATAPDISSSATDGPKPTENSGTSNGASSEAKDFSPRSEPTPAAAGTPPLSPTSE